MAHGLPPARIYVLPAALFLAACSALKPAQAPPPQSASSQWVAPVPIPADTPVKTRPAPQPPVAAQQGAAPLPRPDLPTLALLDFESDSLAPAETMALSQSLWFELLRPTEYGLLPRNETRRWLIANDLYPYMPYQAEVTLGRVVAALKADYLLTGRVDRIGSGYNVALQLTGRDGQPVLKKTGQFSGGSGQLLVGVLQFGPDIRSAVLKGRPAAAPTPISGARTKMKVRVRRAPVQEHVGGTEPEKPAAVEAPPTQTIKPAAAAAATTSTAAAPLPAAAATPTPAKTPTPAPTVTPTPAPTAPPKTLTLKVTPANSPRPTPTSAPKAAATPPPKAVAAPVSGKVARAHELQQQAQELASQSDRQHRPAAILDLLKQAAELAPEDLQVLRGLANEYYVRENYGQSADVYTRALKVDPNNSMLLTCRGSALYCQDKFGSAKEDFAKAIRLDPANNFARFNLALASHMSKSPDAARLWHEYLDKTAGATEDDEIQNRKQAQYFLSTLEKGN